MVKIQKIPDYISTSIVKHQLGTIIIFTIIINIVTVLVFIIIKLLYKHFSFMAFTTWAMSWTSSVTWIYFFKYCPIENRSQMPDSRLFLKDCPATT